MLLKNDGKMYRVLDSDDNRLFVIDCVKRTMPMWKDRLSGYSEITEEDLLKLT